MYAHALLLFFKQDVCHNGPCVLLQWLMRRGRKSRWCHHDRILFWGANKHRYTWQSINNYAANIEHWPLTPSQTPTNSFFIYIYTLDKVGGGQRQMRPTPIPLPLYICRITFYPTDINKLTNINKLTSLPTPTTILSRINSSSPCILYIRLTKP